MRWPSGTFGAKSFANHCPVNFRDDSEVIHARPLSEHCCASLDHCRRDNDGGFKKLFHRTSVRAQAYDILTCSPFGPRYARRQWRHITTEFHSDSTQIELVARLELKG